MKHALLSMTLAGFALSFAGPVMAAVQASALVSVADMADSDLEKRKKKRVKGGSGCDDAHDVIEHPECR